MKNALFSGYEVGLCVRFPTDLEGLPVPPFVHLIIN